MSQLHRHLGPHCVFLLAVGNTDSETFALIKAKYSSFTIRFSKVCLHLAADFGATRPSMLCLVYRDVVM